MREMRRCRCQGDDDDAAELMMTMTIDEVDAVPMCNIVQGSGKSISVSGFSGK